MNMQLLEAFSDGLAEANLDRWRSMQLSPSSVLNIFIEVKWVINPGDWTVLETAGGLKSYQWEIVKQLPSKVCSIKDACTMYQDPAYPESKKIVSFLEQFPRNCVAIVIAMKTPKESGMFTYGFPVN